MMGSQPPSAKSLWRDLCPCSFSYVFLWVGQEGKGPVWLAPVLRESHGAARVQAVLPGKHDGAWGGDRELVCDHSENEPLV